MRWIGIVALVFGVAALVFGIIVMLAPQAGLFNVGLAILLLGVGVSLAGFILFGLITELSKMAPS